MKIDQLNSTLPAEWPDSLMLQIQAQNQANGRTLVVLDDDPTGTQTVYDLPVLTSWSVDTLATEFKRKTPVFFILTNSRSVPESEAVALNREIGRSLLVASQQTGQNFSVVSRSDSTLRGHFPAETDTLTKVLGQQVDGLLLIPYFLEGGRLTINDTHYVLEGETLTPVAQTPFAQDDVFGYTCSNLKEWVAEKSNDRIKVEDILSVSLEDIRTGGPDRVAALLAEAKDSQVVVVNSITMRDMEVFTLGLLQAETAGKRFMYRTAASFVQVRAGLATKPLLTAEDLNLSEQGGGLIVAGSYVPKTSKQIAALFAQTDIFALEVDVSKLLDVTERAAEISNTIAEVDRALTQNEDVLIYTSRKLVSEKNGKSGLAIGRIISDSLVEIVRRLSAPPRYIVAKGGITSSDIGTLALKVKRAHVAGQILPGVPVWWLGDESRYPGLPYIVFPGNVGEINALVTLVERLSAS